MSNLPFRSPLYSQEEDHFSFPTNGAPNDRNSNNPNPFIIQEINPNSLPNTSIPTSNCQDLSMFLDHSEGFPLMGQFPTTPQEIPSEWMKELQFDDEFDDLVQQGAQGSSDEHGIQHQHLMIDHQTHDGGGQGSYIKLDHSAREKIRRMKLSNSYLALRSLLPDANRTFYRRWTAPYILDRTLDYIPRLQAEIDKLTLEKNNLLSLIGKQQQQALISDRDKQDVHKYKQTLTISINEVKRGEVIIQICQHKGKLDHKFSALIEKFEAEDFQVITASSSSVSEDRSCFHLHVQMDENAVEADYIVTLQKKLIFWLS